MEITMTDILRITKLNEVNMRVDAESGIRMELSDKLTFEVPGAKFMPSVRNRVWDGKIRLLNAMTGELYVGLLPEVLEFAKARGYECIVDESLSKQEDFTLNKAEEFVKDLSLPFEPRDYQYNSFVHAVQNNRALVLSPTGSGKSFIIYLLVRYYAKKTLIIVPTTSLVSQLRKDFVAYGLNDKYIHTVTAGSEKGSDKPIVISTWQSIYKQPKKYFLQYDVVIGDECHLFKSKSLTSIMTKLLTCKYRFGFTGTLDGTLTNELVLQGLFGEKKMYTKTKKLIDEKRLAPFNIKCLVLKHKEEEAKDVINRNYQDEMDYLVSHDRRNSFITNLVLSLNGNSLLLFQYVEKHGKILNDLIKTSAPDREIYFIHGGVNTEEREYVRKRVSEKNDIIIIASYGVFSTGINAPNLHNIIFGSPSKSRIRNLQSIGRVLRVSEGKDQAVLYDIADDCKYKSKMNFTLKHFVERVRIYKDEEFRFKIYNIEI
jgi:superfamily II DNA or RNA helicase